MADDEEEEIECPRCESIISASDDECPHCGLDLDEWEEEEKVNELLSKVDDDTYQITGNDKESVLDGIKELAKVEKKKLGKEIFEDAEDQEEEEIWEESDEYEEVFECPICGAEVSEDDEECPNCGAVFE